jgi:hypothetical protein
VNVPAAVTLLRVYLAELHGDAETTVDLVPRAMTARREGEAMLGTIIGWYAGMAEWLRGRPAEAERLLSPRPSPGPGNSASSPDAPARLLNHASVKCSVLPPACHHPAES